MKCNYCGNDLPKDSQFCGNCGAKIEYNKTTNNNQNTTEPIVLKKVNNSQEEDKGSFGWAVLGFFIPIVGLILYLTWKDRKPKNAKMAIIGAAVGFCLNVMNVALI